MERWKKDKGVELVVNCLTHGTERDELLAVEYPRGRMERTQHFLKKSVAHMARGGSELVHCRHGIHRTGSFITLLLSMLLMMSFRSVLSLTSTMPTWTETVKIA